MSIFGIKKKYTKEDVNNLHKKILPVTNLIDKVENLKSTITIIAESRGSVKTGEVFSFGNGGKHSQVGYVVMRRGYITGISLSSGRISGEVRVGVLLNGKILKGCEITLLTRPTGHDNFDIPFLVEAGSFINFINLASNSTTVNTVVGLLFKFNQL